jgi:hypothetical protein
MYSFLNREEKKRGIQNLLPPVDRFALTNFPACLPLRALAAREVKEGIIASV